jgi:hypothetical protein
VREDRLELRRQHLLGNLHHAHTTQACPIPGGYGLFSGKPLAYFDHGLPWRVVAGVLAGRHDLGLWLTMMSWLAAVV